MGEVSVTLKAGKGYEDTWLNFRGEASEVRKDIVDVFELVDDGSLTLHQLVLDVTDLFHATQTVSGIGGKPVGSRDSVANNAWQKAAEGRSSEGKDPIVEQLEAASDLSTLQLIWADNQKAFEDNPDLLGVYRARGKALKAAGK